MSRLEAINLFSDYGINLSDEAREQWLRDKICAGLIGARFDGIEITPKIASILFEYCNLKWPDEKAGCLPADMAICRADLHHLLARDGAARIRRGRPERSGSFEELDIPLIEKMDQMIRDGLTLSATAAAQSIVTQGLAAGNSTELAKTKRLVKRYRKHFG
jgi:hypothetical protein